MIIAQYTETLNEYIANGGEVYASLFAKFPAFNLLGAGNDLNMYNLFVDKYDIREIGAESEELFSHFLKEKIEELLIKYVPKINMFLTNFNDLFKFTVQLSYNEIGSNTGNNQNTYYLNPVSTNTTNLKVDNVDKKDITGSYSMSRSKDVLQSVWGKTRASLLEQIMNLESIYYNCVNEFSTLFIGVM